MPALAVKISEELAEAARLEAVHTDRSLTGQVEHWAKIGRATEANMTVSVVTALKRSGGDLNAIEDPAARRAVLEALDRLKTGEHFAATSEKLLKVGGARYEVDPLDPKGIVQVRPDGSRVRGKMVGRKFVSAE
jgi:ParD-like antitoxin of type II bacterial toxin-antitoxin system